MLSKGWIASAIYAISLASFSEVKSIFNWTLVVFRIIQGPSFACFINSLCISSYFNESINSILSGEKNGSTDKKRRLMPCFLQRFSSLSMCSSYCA